jgi:putative flavoprotein involved in K+ transport
LATRHPVRFIPQRIGGEDVHYWLREAGFDTLPAQWLTKIAGGSVVTDSVGFAHTLAGDSADAAAVIAPLVAWIRDAPRTVGLATIPTGSHSQTSTG